MSASKMLITPIKIASRVEIFSLFIRFLFKGLCT